jgi:quercetin dioxygenase-like cupin family protein
MISVWTSWGRLSSTILVAAGLFLSAGGSLGSADAGGAPPVPDLNPAMVTYQHPDQIKWTGNSSGPQQAVLLGDPSKPGLYIVLVKWNPHSMSHPHFHPNDRYITVLSGTWWVGSGTKFDPDSTVPMPAGSYVVDLAKQPHYDGAKDDTAIIEIVGEGPATITPAEEK